MRDRKQSRGASDLSNLTMLQLYQHARSEDDLSNDELVGALIGFDARGVYDACMEPNRDEFDMIVLTKSLKFLTTLSMMLDFHPILIQERGETSVVKFRKLDPLP